MKSLFVNKLSVLYDSGQIRHIICGNFEILRMIYPAVRDRNWGTIKAQIVNEKIITNKKSFLIEYKAIYKENNIHFEADYLISGDENNTISFEMRGIAKSDFFKNRIGLCILLPIKECVGKPFETISPEGSKNESFFPNQISSNQPAKNIKELFWSINGIKSKLYFEGDVFEMEDQRNWTDASYKIYSTPLDIPFPTKIKKNEGICQKVILQLSEVNSVDFRKDEIDYIRFESKKYKLPNIGFSKSTQNMQLSETQVDLLKKITFEHYRVDIHFSDNNWKEKYCNIIDEANKLHAALFLTLHFTKDWKNEINGFLTYLSYQDSIPAYVLLLDEKARISTNELIEYAVPFFKKQFPKIFVGAGTDAYFAELNRSDIKGDNVDFVSFSICPQIHASDDLSLVENLESQYYAVKSAQKLFPEKQIFVSPITLQQRFNVVATDETTLNKNEELSTKDERQLSIFNALWTLISIKYLSESGIDLITYFETTGSNGIIDKEIIPVYHIFEMIKEARNIIKTNSTSPLTVDSICLEFDNNTILYLVNFSEDIQRVRLPKEFQTSNKIQIIGNNYEVSEPYKESLMTIQGKSILGIQINR